METKTKETTKVKRTVATIKNGKNIKRLRIPRENNNNLEDSIRKRAYEIYLERGAVSGNEIDDWTKAENEMKQTARKEKYFEKDNM
jgi:hypothetical protein